MGGHRQGNAKTMREGVWCKHHKVPSSFQKLFEFHLAFL